MRHTVFIVCTLMVFAARAESVANWPMLSCCVMPPKFITPLFETAQLISPERERKPISPVVLVPSSDAKTPSPKAHMMVFPPEFGLANERGLTGPTDKSSGKWLFTPWYKVNRPLKAGDTFGWRMRIYAPDQGASDHPSVLEEIIAPKGTPLHSRYSPSSWVDNRPTNERNKPAPHNGTIFHIVEEYPDNGRQVWSLTTGPKVLTAVTGTFHAFNFWTVTDKDPKGDYMLKIWLHNKVIAEMNFTVQP
jgi:hypothetical protein